MVRKILNYKWLQVIEETAHKKIIACTKITELKKNRKISLQIKMLVGKPSGKMVKYYKQQYSLYRIIYMKLEPLKTEGDKRWSSVINMVNNHLVFHISRN